MAVMTENIERLEKALEENSKSTLAFRAAKHYYNKGDFEKAISLCTDSLSQYPDYLSGYVILANSYLNENDFSNAVKYFNIANKLFPNHWSLKPFAKKLENEGFYSKISEPKDESEKESLIPESSIIDDQLIDSAIEERKAFQGFETSKIKEYIDEKKSGGEFGDNASTDVITFPEEYLTLHDFSPKADAKSNHDEIIESLIIESSTEKSDESPTQGTSAVRIPTERYNLETELKELLPQNDILIEEIKKPYEETVSEEEILNAPPKLVSKTLAEVYESQGKYEEAIEVYIALYNNGELPQHEFDERILFLQDKMKPEPSS